MLTAKWAICGEIALSAGMKAECQQPSHRGIATGGRAVELPKPAALDTAGQRSGITAMRQVVVRDAASFAALWKEHAGPQSSTPPPAVDFKKQDVVAVFLGSKPTGGFTVKIEDIKPAKT